jgi:two-component system phosphate regulon sensor histidine kinase PhoR
VKTIVNFDINVWFFLLIPVLGLWIWTQRRFQERERLRNDLLTAFASRNDAVTTELADLLDESEATVWRRLITLRKSLEDSEREHSQARKDMEDVLAALQDAVLVVDGEGRMRYLNAAALRLFEVRIESVLGANLIEALPSFGLDAAVRSALKEGVSTAREVHLYAPRLREVLLRVAPIFSGGGQVAGAVAIAQDLTELRRLERVRRDFVANASHELRTPVANIRATAETLLHDPDDPEMIRRFLPPMINEAERLSRLVSDLLDLARAETAEPVPFASVDVERVVHSVLEGLRDKAERRNIKIQLDCGPGRHYVTGDAAALEQVAFNLVDNALSYTPPGGGVILRLQQNKTDLGDGGDEPRETTILEVTDTGIGIPEADLPRIFERFYRVDKARSRAEGGTGLGLAIVKHIVEFHGGKVEVESKIGKGSTFRVRIPALTGG